MLVELLVLVRRTEQLTGPKNATSLDKLVTRRLRRINVSRSYNTPFPAGLRNSNQVQYAHNLAARWGTKRQHFEVVCIEVSAERFQTHTRDAGNSCGKCVCVSMAELAINIVHTSQRYNAELSFRRLQPIPSHCLFIPAGSD